MKRIKTYNETMSYWIKAATVQMYVILMIGIFPIFFLDSGTALISAKIISYQYLNLIVIVMFLLAGIAWLSEWVKGDHQKTAKPAVNKIDFFAVTLAAAMIISTLASQNMQEAFWGTHGKKFGAFVLLICVLNYFAISRYFRLSKTVIWMFLLGSSFTYLLQIINHWRFNPLKLWEASNQFAAAIGNINLNAAYDVFMLSIGMGLFTVVKEKSAQQIYAGYLYLGFCGLLCCRSDLGIAGIFTTFLVLMWFTLRDEELCFRCIRLFIIFGASAGTIALGRIFWGKYMFPFDSTIAILTYPAVPVFIIAMGIGAMALYKWEKKNNQKFVLFLARIHRIFFALVLTGIMAGIVLLILINSLFQNAVMPEWFSIFRFTDKFASNRGYIWIRSIKEYAASPWRYKLTGYGANCFSDFINPKYYGEMAERGAGIYVDAHNELIQMLVTTGILGVIGYFGMQLSILLTSIRQIHTNKVAIIPAAVIFSLLVQGMFYSPHVTVTPLVFIFLGIVEAERRKKDTFAI